MPVWMRRVFVLLVIGVTLLALANIQPWQSGNKEGKSSLESPRDSDEQVPLNAYSCDCEPDDEGLTPEMLELAALHTDIIKGSQIAHSDVSVPSGRIDIIIDTLDRTLSICLDGKVYREFTVAVGKPSTPSPPGQWQVVSKGAWSGGFGTRWLGLNMPWGTYGIHGTNKPWQIGDWVSGGCIRMFNHDIESVFSWIPIGTQVVIIGNPFGPLRNPRRELGPGERGSDVLAVQKRLRMLGFDPGAENGMYGEPTVNAVKRFQQACSVHVTGVVTDEVYDALGLMLFE